MWTLTAPAPAAALSFSSARFYLARKECWLATLVAVCVSVCSTPELFAKEKKIPRIVTGVVLDEADDGIVGATVELTDLQTGEKLATYTKEGGRYQFSDLQPTHDYEVRANYKSLSSEVRKVSSFDNRNRIVLNLSIPPPKS